MAESSVFDWLSGVLAETTSLSSIEARGTVRLALKTAGLDPRHLDVRQALVVVRQVLPRELEVRGIDGAPDLCDELARRVVGEAPRGEDARDSPTAVFTRIGR